MTIYLAQHGKSLSEDLDPLRGLAPEGITETQQIAQLVKQQGLVLDQIYHSGKNRAAQTAQIFADYLQPLQGIAPINGINPMDDVQILALDLKAYDKTLFVGHLPYLEKLVSLLTVGDPIHPVLKFQNSAIVCLVPRLNNELWQLKWALVPHL